MLIEITTPHVVKQSKEEDLINKQYKINATLNGELKMEKNSRNLMRKLNLSKSGITSIFTVIDGKLYAGCH